MGKFFSARTPVYRISLRFTAYKMQNARPITPLTTDIMIPIKLLPNSKKGMIMPIKTPATYKIVAFFINAPHQKCSGKA